MTSTEPLKRKSPSSTLGTWRTNSIRFLLGREPTSDSATTFHDYPDNQDPRTRLNVQRTFDEHMGWKVTDLRGSSRQCRNKYVLALCSGE